MPRVQAAKFFQEQSAHSRVKADIVYKYAIAWARVFLTSKKREPLATEAAYVDFFAGPGTYDDGNQSTPLLIAKATIASPALRQGLRMYFNDAEPALIQSLEQEVRGLAGFEDLRHRPSFSSQLASVELIDSLGIRSDVPQFFFLDQFGWADVSPAMIKRIFQARRCDCAFFFRTSRVIAAVSNASAELAMVNLFGQSRLATLRGAFRLPHTNREQSVLHALRDVMRDAGAPLFQAFPFWIRHAGSSRHHLIYLGKNELGLSIMKEIMSKSSSSDEAGVPVIGFSEGAWTRSLFEADPIDDLMQQLRLTFAGKTLNVSEVFSRHHPTNDRFLLRHYQEAIRRLEESENVTCNPPRIERPRRGDRVTMSEMVSVTFKKKEADHESELQNRVD